MPTFSDQQLKTIPKLVKARLEIIEPWFYSSVKEQDRGLFTDVYNNIVDYVKPRYDPDPSSVHRCVGTVSYYINRAIKKYHASPESFFRNHEFIGHLIQLQTTVSLDKLYKSLEEMTKANPDFLEIERMQLEEEKTPLFDGFVFEYIAPEDRVDPNSPKR